MQTSMVLFKSRSAVRAKICSVYIYNMNRFFNHFNNDHDHRAAN